MAWRKGQRWTTEAWEEGEDEAGGRRNAGRQKPGVGWMANHRMQEADERRTTPRGKTKRRCGTAIQNPNPGERSVKW